MDIRKLENLQPDRGLGLAWETLVKASQTSGFMQSLVWAGFKQKQGLIPLHLGIFRDEKLIGGSIFYTARNNKQAGIMVAPDGPVLPWPKISFADFAEPEESLELVEEALHKLICVLESFARESGNIAVRIEPRIKAPGPVFLSPYGRAPVDLNPRETLYLNLQQEPAAILASMKSKARYNIGLAQRRGVDITVHTTAQPAVLSSFYRIMQEAANRDNFALESFSFFIDLAESLCSAGLGRFIFAEHEQEPLAAMFLVTYGERATFLYGGISNHKRNLMAGYALQWAAFQESIKAGCTEYDFYGFDPHQAPSNRYAKFSRFKRQFGGDVKRFIGAHDYYFTAGLADAVIKALREIDVDTSRVS